MKLYKMIIIKNLLSHVLSTLSFSIFQVKYCTTRKNVEKITKLNIEKLLSNYYRVLNPIASCTIKITSTISCYFNTTLKSLIYFDR